MEICECASPAPTQHSPGQMYCASCRRWWLPDHGSRRPGDNRPTRDQVARPTAKDVSQLKNIFDTLK